MLIPVQVANPSSTQAQMLEVANVIANYKLKPSSPFEKVRENDFLPKKRGAYCLALLAAGASVFMPDNAFHSLNNRCAEFTKAADPAHFELLEKTRCVAADIQDYSNHFSSQACLFFSAGSYHLYCDYNRLEMNDIHSTITWAFCQVLKNVDELAELPRFQIKGTCDHCNSATNRAVDGRYHCLTCKPHLGIKCPACGIASIECNCKHDSWE